MRSTRRTFLVALTAAFSLLPGASHARTWWRSPVKTNRLRPPGAVGEDSFAGHCIRCGRCVEVCPYHCIVPLDVRQGVYAGTPMIPVEEIPCHLCMKCVKVCPTGTLTPLHQTKVRMGLAVVDKLACVSWKGDVLCRTCYNVCPFPNAAIRLDDFRPVIDETRCTGCGLCVHGCPVTRSDGFRAINIEPIYSFGPKLVDEPPVS